MDQIMKEKMQTDVSFPPEKKRKHPKQIAEQQKQKKKTRKTCIGRKSHEALFLLPSMASNKPVSKHSNPTLEMTSNKLGEEQRLMSRWKYQFLCDH